MAKTNDSAGNGEKFYRQMLKAQFDAYLKIGVRKHGLSADLLHTDADRMTNEQLAAAVTVLRDLAHLPPE